MFSSDFRRADDRSARLAVRGKRVLTVTAGYEFTLLLANDNRLFAVCRTGQLGSSAAATATPTTLDPDIAASRTL